MSFNVNVIGLPDSSIREVLSRLLTELKVQHSVIDNSTKPENTNWNFRADSDGWWYGEMAITYVPLSEQVARRVLEDGVSLLDVPELKQTFAWLKSCAETYNFPSSA